MDSEIILNITGMSCTSCAGRVEKALNSLKEVKHATVNFPVKKAFVSSNGHLDITQLITAVENAGYGASSSHSEKISYSVEGMSCASCALNIEKSLNSVNGIVDAKINFANKKAEITFNDSKVSIRDIKKVVKDKGYSLVKTEESDTKEEERLNREKKRLIIAWAVTLPLTIKMLGEMLLGIFIGGHNVAFIADLIISFPVIFIIGYPVIKITIKSIRKFDFNMDSLIGIGTIAAYSTGVLKLFGMEISSFAVVGAMIMSINFIGNYLKEMATGKASQAIKKLLKLGAKSAHLLLEDGSFKDTPVEDLLVNDIVVIKPGEKVPVDGVIVTGETSIDESIATGESIPVDKKIGDKVIGATINQQGSINVKIEKVGKDTFLSQIVKMVEEAQGTKIPIQAFADKVTSIFVPVVLSISILSLLFWLIFPGIGRDILEIFQGIIPWVNLDRNLVSMALFASIATLVIACPCALGLATPTALMVGMGKGATSGILIRNGEAIQTAQKIDTVIFDKTGTITVGRPTIVDFKSSLKDSDFFKYLGAIENKSEHPLAKSVVAYIKKMNYEIINTEEFKSVTGKGVSGKVDGSEILVGSEGYFKELDIDYSEYKKIIEEYYKNGYTVIFTAMNRKIIGVTGIADEIKSDSLLAISKLHELGLKTVMLTGDNKKSAQAIANNVNIDKVYSELMPEDKINIVKQLQGKGKIVAMVGDGINDAPALKQANVGIAIGTGTDIAIETADITLVSGSLTGVVKAIKLSKATFKKILQNLFWAFIYNVIAIPMAVFGLLHPVIAEIAMALSSINVVTNSLRLKNKNIFD